MGIRRNPSNVVANLLIFTPTLTFIAVILAYALIDYFTSASTSDGYALTDDFMSASTSDSSEQIRAVVAVALYAIGIISIISAIPLLLMGIRIKRSNVPDTFANTVNEIEFQFFDSDQESDYNDFLSRVIAIEQLLDSLSSEGASLDEINNAQRLLDAVASEHQGPEKIKEFQYILYELQAKIHYIQSNDELVVEFLNDAIDARGTTYPRIENMIKDLSSDLSERVNSYLDDNLLSKIEKRKLLIGIEGWLAFFVAAIIVSIIVELGYLILLLHGLSSGTSIYSSEETFGLFILSSISIFSSSAAMILIINRRKLGKAAAIILLILYVVLNLIVYSWVSSKFSGYDSGGYVTSSAGDLGRSILSGVIWITYFIFSKRVAMTLNR